MTFASIFVAGSAVASLTFSTNSIAGDGSISLNQTGQPVTVNGDLTVTGTCTGCGGGGRDGTDTQIQFNNAGSLGGFGSWDGTTLTTPVLASTGGQYFGDGDIYGLVVLNITGTNVKNVALNVEALVTVHEPMERGFRTPSGV